MSFLPDIYLSLNGSVLLLIIFCMFAIVLSYFVYRSTIPPVSRAWRVVLTSLRALALIAILLLLFEPVLGLRRTKTEKPVIAVLVDNSASMALVDQSTDRGALTRTVLAHEAFDNLADRYDVQYFGFSDRIQQLGDSGTDSLSFTADGTDILAALQGVREQLADRHFSAAILVTDGANNLGSNPVRYASDYGKPIYPVAIGDASEQSDILISNYITNEIVYADTRVPVDVYIKSSGFNGQRVNVSLTQEGKILEQKSLRLSGGGFEQKVRMFFSPESEGIQKYELQVPNLAGELTGVNNRKSFYVKVLQSRQKVLLVSGGPGPDHLFLKRVLNNDETIELITYTGKGNASFYENPPDPETQNTLDLVTCVDFPRKDTPAAAIEMIRGILSRGKPLLLFYGKSTNIQKLQQLKDFIPFDNQIVRSREETVYFEPKQAGRYHPIFRLSENDSENQSIWRDLPPVYTDIRSAGLKPTAQVVAGIDLTRTGRTLNRRAPLAVASRAGTRKSVALLAYGLWRWDLLMWGVGKDNSSYTTFIRNTIRWLTSSEDSKQVRITSNKEIYRSGEEIKFQAQVYYEDFATVDGAEVSVQLSGNESTHELSLSGIGEGRYEGRFQVLAGGDYRFQGTAHQDGRILGRDTGRFSVEAFNLEFQNTRMNEDLLRRLAQESNGEYYSPDDDLTDLEDHMQFPDKSIILKSEWQLWNLWTTLVVCLLLLTAEWFIRKRKGML